MHKQYPKFSYKRCNFFSVQDACYLNILLKHDDTFSPYSCKDIGTLSGWKDLRNSSANSVQSFFFVFRNCPATLSQDAMVWVCHENIGFKEEFHLFFIKIRNILKDIGIIFCRTQVILSLSKFQIFLQQKCNKHHVQIFLFFGFQSSPGTSLFCGLRFFLLKKTAASLEL